MFTHKIDFSGISWQEPQAGVRFKLVYYHKTRVREVEFTPEFAEEGWCTQGHMGFVIEGHIDIDFSGRVESFHAGDGILIPPGPLHKHKAHVPEGVARLFLVEEMPEEEVP